MTRRLECDSSTTVIDDANPSLQLHLGFKTDAIEYRYSYDWLFELLAEEKVFRVQLGTFFEFYELPDDFFLELRHRADRFGIWIQSVFTSHRELGGFFQRDLGFESVARQKYERLIEVGSLVGAESVGSNPGSVLRDRMHEKAEGLAVYLQHMEQLMGYAKDCGLRFLTIEPMSCLAEPPTLPGEIEAVASKLDAYHQHKRDTTVPVGFCADIAHGYADREGTCLHDNLELFAHTIPHLFELHVKNTDSKFDSTFGFGDDERGRGIVDVENLRTLLLSNANRLPKAELTGYLEISGPKLGRDYSDHLLERQLRSSLQHLATSFVNENDCRSARSARHTPSVRVVPHRSNSTANSDVLLAPSIMCMDFLHLERELRTLESLAVDLLHVDLMDGHFVPNMPLGLDIVKQIRSNTSIPLDVHLMVTDNDAYIRKLVAIGVQQISVHCESAVHLDRTLALIRETGAKAGLAINPATPLNILDYTLERLDYILLMTVNPGYAGQELVPAAIRKIRDCSNRLRYLGKRLPIQVDGNVSFSNIPNMVQAGAGCLVLGTSSLFSSSGTLTENYRRVNEAVQVEFLPPREPNHAATA